MAHAIETMFSVRQTPWHTLGTVLANNPTISEGLTQSGLDWPVETTPLHVHNSGGYLDISEHGKAVRRTTDGKILGVVGPDWTPLQNATAFEFFAPFLDSKECVLTTAGSLHGGKVVWILAEITREPVKVRKGDTVRKFLLLSNAHDGSRAVKVGFTPIRVVCANTLAMSDNTKSPNIRIKHTKSVVYTLSQVRETIDIINRSFNATGEMYRKLTNLKVNPSDLARYMRVMLATDPNAATRAEEQAIADCVSRAMSDVRGNGEGTAWDAYNGLTEYLSYATKHRTADSRLTSLWFGDNQKLLQDALTTALAL